MNEIPFNFNDSHALPTDELEISYSHNAHDVAVPPQSPHGNEEYICGHTGNAHPYANPGRDQDHNRQDECTPAQAFARYVH